MNKTMQAMQERFSVQLFPARCYKSRYDALKEFHALPEKRCFFNDWYNERYIEPLEDQKARRELDEYILMEE